MAVSSISALDAARTKKTRWDHWTHRLATGYEIDANGCHVWQRSRNSRGYGVIWFDGRLHLAHRAAWLNAHGQWPAPGMVVDHTCENKACVNPKHLRELENWENVRRAYPMKDDPESERKRAANRASQARSRGSYSPTYNPLRGESR